ncbi:HNH endonuclease [Aquibium pacificus]|uniref:HNH endonuclease n=1 Tax=Aquibium pacificus TaxID=3153579 RepID=UPI00349FB103
MSELHQSGVRCGICRGLVHRNSISADHVIRRADGGDNSSRNAQLSHPYCNSAYKN